MGVVGNWRVSCKRGVAAEIKYYCGILLFSLLNNNGYFGI
jgi:hypothetical protein